MVDLSFGGRSGVDLRGYPDGVYVGGWYDGNVGIEGAFVTWDELDAIRAKSRRRIPYHPIMRLGGGRR